MAHSHALCNDLFFYIAKPHPFTILLLYIPFILCIFLSHDTQVMGTAHVIIFLHSISLPREQIYEGSRWCWPIWRMPRYEDVTLKTLLEPKLTWKVSFVPEHSYQLYFHAFLPVLRDQLARTGAGCKIEQHFILDCH